MITLEMSSSDDQPESDDENVEVLEPTKKKSKKSYTNWTPEMDYDLAKEYNHIFGKCGKKNGMTVPESWETIRLRLTTKNQGDRWKDFQGNCLALQKHFADMITALLDKAGVKEASKNLSGLSNPTEYEKLVYELAFDKWQSQQQTKAKKVKMEKKKEKQKLLSRIEETHSSNDSNKVNAKSVDSSDSSNSGLSNSTSRPNSKSDIVKDVIDLGEELKEGVKLLIQQQANQAEDIETKELQKELLRAQVLAAKAQPMIVKPITIPLTST